MCTPIVEIVEAEGAGKGGEGWFAMSHAVVSYDHPHRALLDEAITIDFVNRDRGPGPHSRTCVAVGQSCRHELSPVQPQGGLVHGRVPIAEKLKPEFPALEGSL